MAKSVLTSKQRKFIDEYMVDRNATQAALRTGYSENSAKEQGARLLSNANIKEEIAKREKSDSEQVGIAKMQILELLGMMLNLDPLELVETKSVEKISDSGEGFTMTFLSVKALQDMPKEVRVLISGIRQTKDGIEIKWPDKFKVIDILNKMLGFYDVHNDQKAGLNRPMQHFTDAELEAIVEKKRLGLNNG